MAALTNLIALSVNLEVRERRLAPGILPTRLQSEAAQLVAQLIRRQHVEEKPRKRAWSSGSSSNRARPATTSGMGPTVELMTGVPQRNASTTAMPNPS